MNVALLIAALAVACPAEPDLIVLRGATLIDGSGQPAIIGDLAIQGERIVAMGKLGTMKSTREVDAKGLVVAPGFIDLHTHSDFPLQNAKTRDNLGYAWQGVSTEVTGNCGSGPVDVADFYVKLERNGVGCNVAHLVPHNDVRAKVMGNVNRTPTNEELAKMVDLVDAGMKAGAWGFSTGLIYNPGTYSKTDELIALATPAGRHGGIYASHIRDEGAGLLDAISEAIRIGKEAKLPAHVSHIKCTGKNNWGRSTDAIAIIEAARASGQKVTADQYPYTASSTSLRALVVPARFREGSAKDFQARVEDPDSGPKIRDAIARAVGGRDGGKTLRVAGYKHKREWQGKNIAEIADLAKMDPVDVVLEIEKNGGAQMVAFGMSEDDLRIYLKRPWVATASDGSPKVADDTVPHPRSYGTFPRKIGLYCIKEQLISLEQAIRSCSGLPADIIALPERGYLKTEFFADVVVFDPKTIIDKATYDQPHQHADGVKWLFVNGVAVIEDGKATGKLPGKPLRHTNNNSQTNSEKP